MRETVNSSGKADVLVALLPSPRDLEIATERGWYRVRSREMLQRVRGPVEQFSHIAFYQPDSFRLERRCIARYARIVGVSTALRIELLPDEPNHPGATEEYVRIDLGEVKTLPHPILSARGRRILFIPTSWERMAAAADINDLFTGGPLEDTLYSRLREFDLLPERQFYLEAKHPSDPRKTGKFFLDMAILCQERNLDIECDGDTWHSRRDAIRADNERDNLLQTNRWHVLRFNTTQIIDRLDETLDIVRTAINKYGGVLQPDLSVRHFSSDGRLGPSQTELRF